MARFTCRYTPTYFYKFSYTHDPTALGAGHAEELFYLFNSPFNNPNDMIIRNRLVKLWTNFAKTGNPTPLDDPILDNCIWPKVIPAALNYIDIDNDLTIKQNPNAQDMAFWDNLFSAYANPPLFTY
ncbi:Carboxylesterase family [Popillia japonica]|uniref:Carboxylesterase family n=1 Tax=Popillia japonica TaxID=7064 RepID=A0AAW1L764_POPJA